MIQSLGVRQEKEAKVGLGIKCFTKNSGMSQIRASAPSILSVHVNNCV